MPMNVTTLWDPAEHLHRAVDMAACLEAAFEEGDPALVAAAPGDIAKAKAKGQRQVFKQYRPWHGRQIRPSTTRQWPVKVTIRLEKRRGPAGQTDTVR